MSVPQQNPITASTANGVSTVFGFDFYVDAEGDLVVQVDGLSKTLNVDYTVTGTGVSSGGSVIFNTAPGNGALVTIYRDTPLERQDDFQTAGDLQADVLDRQFDRLWQALQEIFGGSKGSPTALRVPNGESVDPLPVAAVRANRLVGFDSLGRPIAVLPGAGDATALALDLANTVTPAKGAGQVGFNSSLSYAAGTVGAALKDLASTSTGYIFRGSGQAGDDTAAFAAFYAALPIGAAVRILGAVRITSTLTLNRRISLLCHGDADCFVVDVGVTNDGIVVNQGTANDELGTATAGGINGISLALNVYGKANACKNAVRLTRADRSRIFTKIYAGAVQYGLVLDGCLINQIEYHGSANYKPPITSPAFQVDHMLVQKNTTYNVATNANRITVTMEGGRHGYTQSAQSGEGGNLVTGCIEGLTGRAFTIGACKWLHLADLWLEVNTTASTFDSCDGLRIGPGVVNFGTSDDFVFTNCRGLTIDHYYGGYFIASSCLGTTLGQIGTPDATRNICSDVSVVQHAYLNAANGLSGQAGGQGAPSLENVYSNPYFDIWADSGPNAAPRGVTGGASALINRITGTVYPGNPNIYAMRVTASVTGIGNCCSLTLSFTPQSNEWYSFFVAVYVPSGQPGVIVHAFNNTTYYELGRNTASKDTWLEFRGSAPAIAGQAMSIAISGWNGSSYVAGQVYVGGCNVVRGPIAPRALGDHGRRRANIIGTIANAPDLAGQVAIVGTSPPIAYIAVSNGSSTDWKQAT